MNLRNFFFLSCISFFTLHMYTEVPRGDDSDHNGYGRRGERMNARRDKGCSFERHNSRHIRHNRWSNDRRNRYSNRGGLHSELGIYPYWDDYRWPDYDDYGTYGYGGSDLGIGFYL